jgi:predicted aspartyl protease
MGDARRQLKRITVIGIAVLTGACATATTPKMTEVPLRMVGSYAVLPVHVAGSEPLLFILDTGAGGSVISPATRASLAIDPSQSRFDTIVGAGGKSQMESVPLAALTVGDFTVEDLRAVVIDLAKFQRDDGTQYAGILGQDFLKRFDVEIDLPGERLRLHDNAAGAPLQLAFDAGPPVRNQSDDIGWLKFDAMLDGHPVGALVDSGSPRTIINWHAARAAGLTETSDRVRKRERPTSGLGAGAAATYDLGANTLSLGGTNFGATAVRIADLPIFELIGTGDRPAMIAGLDLLRRCAMYIDYDQRTVRLCRTPTPPSP